MAETESVIRQKPMNKMLKDTPLNSVLTNVELIATDIAYRLDLDCSSFIAFTLKG